ncbi:MAG: hypothetical protein AAF601_10080 [Pseudomonadota bacterium]
MNTIGKPALFLAQGVGGCGDDERVHAPGRVTRRVDLAAAASRKIERDFLAYLAANRAIFGSGEGCEMQADPPGGIFLKQRSRTRRVVA